VALDLSYRIDIDLLGVGVRFPCLKVLHLQDLLMLDDHASIEKLLAGSPVLEALKFEHEDCESRNALRICSSSLERLIIRFTFIAYYVKDPGCRALKVVFAWAVQPPVCQILKLFLFKIIFLLFLDCFNVLVLNIFFKNKKYYFNVNFPSKKNNLKSNHYHVSNTPYS
jgi:hypothetical protein